MIWMKAKNHLPLFDLRLESGLVRPFAAHRCNSKHVEVPRIDVLSLSFGLLIANTQTKV